VRCGRYFLASGKRPQEQKQARYGAEKARFIRIELQCIWLVMVPMGVNTTETGQIMSKKCRDRLACRSILSRMTRRIFSPE
jgi:hypothetical protein